ncbi:chaplin [Streptomyces sp. NPDC051105]|uniref:chaplin n=1 Tax=Streptomyces sp. NPDC051105 TaxID=3154843 RepID=UPI0034258EAE
MDAFSPRYQEAFMRIRALAVTGAIAATLALGTTAAYADNGGNGGNGANATGTAVNSPGVLSGNVVQVPISIPINVCGNTVNVLALLNPAVGNSCSNR